MIDSSVDTYAAQVSVGTLYWAADKIRKGALTDVVLDAAYDHLDTQFLAYMIVQADARRELRHVFDWGQTKNDLGAPLWKTIMTGAKDKRVVSYAFLPSRNPVPIREELQGYGLKEHVFRDKARIFETGESVIIARKPETQWLVYINEQRGAGFTENSPSYVDGNGTTFAKGPSYIERSGGYKFKNQFANEFFIWWTSEAGAGVGLDYLANRLTRQVAVQTARFASAKARVGSYRGVMNRKNATPEAKAKAERAINEIKMQWRKDRRDKL